MNAGVDTLDTSRLCFSQYASSVQQSQSLVSKANGPVDQLVLIPLEHALCLIRYVIDWTYWLGKMRSSLTVLKNIDGAAAEAEAAAAWVAHVSPGSGFPPS